MLTQLCPNSLERNLLQPVKGVGRAVQPLVAQPGRQLVRHKLNVLRWRVETRQGGQGGLGGWAGVLGRSRASLVSKQTQRTAVKPGEQRQGGEGGWAVWRAGCWVRSGCSARRLRRPSRDAQCLCAAVSRPEAPASSCCKGTARPASRAEPTPLPPLAALSAQRLPAQPCAFGHCLSWPKCQK